MVDEGSRLKHIVFRETNLCVDMCGLGWSGGYLNVL